MKCTLLQCVRSYFNIVMFCERNGLAIAAAFAWPVCLLAF